MKIFSLVYASRAAKTISRDEVIKILKLSQKNNSDLNITGMLIYENDSFLQRLEGLEADVEKTFARISADPRHYDCKVIEKNPSDTREFANWSMELVVVSDDDRLKSRLGDDFVFEPGSMTATEANRLLKVLRNTSYTG